MLSFTTQLRCRPMVIGRCFSYSHVFSSGHNKWSKIKQKKGANDAQKGTLFGRASREIAVAVKNGGSVDPTKNPQLAAALKWAKEQDVPRENIEKALAKAGSGKDKEGHKERGDFTYEALAFNSVGVIIECSTDNKNRTIQSLREILNKHNAHTTPVKFMFQQKGSIILEFDRELQGDDVEKLVEYAYEAGADDFDQLEAESDNACKLKLTCHPDALDELCIKLANANEDQAYYLVGSKVVFNDLVYVPSENHLPNESDELKSQTDDLRRDLTEHEDVKQVWTSLDR